MLSGQLTGISLKVIAHGGFICVVSYCVLLLFFLITDVVYIMPSKIFKDLISFIDGQLEQQKHRMESCFKNG